MARPAVVEATVASQSNAARTTGAAARATPQVDGPWAAVGQSFPGSPCGSDPIKDLSSSSPDEADLAQAIGSDMGSLSVPFRNARWRAVTNDGTFARVLVCLQMRMSAADSWQEYVADTELAKVAGHWRSNASLRPDPVDAWTRVEASKTAAAEVRVAVVRLEARDRPKELFGDAGKSYVATVRWSTDDHARHTVRYGVWFAVDGHNCLPYSSFGAQTTPPQDVEQQMSVSTPLAADGTLDVRAPIGEVVVDADPIEKEYSIEPTSSNKVSVQCTSIDNPHGLQLRVTAVDGTPLPRPIDTPATPPAFPSR